MQILGKKSLHVMAQLGFPGSSVSAWRCTYRIRAPSGPARKAQVRCSEPTPRNSVMPCKRSANCIMIAWLRQNWKAHEKHLNPLEIWPGETSLRKSTWCHKDKETVECADETWAQMNLNSTWSMSWIARNDLAVATLQRPHNAEPALQSLVLCNHGWSCVVIWYHQSIKAYDWYGHHITITSDCDAKIHQAPAVHLPRASRPYHGWWLPMRGRGSTLRGQRSAGRCWMAELHCIA